MSIDLDDAKAIFAEEKAEAKEEEGKGERGTLDEAGDESGDSEDGGHEAKANEDLRHLVTPRHEPHQNTCLC